MTRRSSGLTTILMCGAAAAFCASLARAATPNGHAIFEQKCAMCHGQHGHGKAMIHTPNFTSPKWQAYHSDAQIKSTIENGKKGTYMRAFKNTLKPNQIDALVVFIRSLNSKKK